MVTPDHEHHLGQPESEGIPRPPSVVEIAQAILDHLSASGKTPNDFSGSYQELHDEGGGSSTISFWGPFGDGEFTMPWPTTPLEDLGE